VLSVLVGIDDQALGGALRDILEAQGHAVLLVGPLEVGASGWPQGPHVLVIDGDSPQLDLGVLWAGWGRRADRPVVLVMVGTAEAQRAAERIGALVIAKPISAARLAAEIVQSRAAPGAPVLSASYALRALGLAVGGLAEDEAAAIVSGAAHVSLEIVRDALRPVALHYISPTPIFEALRRRGALDEAALRFALDHAGARTLRPMIDTGGLAPEDAARLAWALLSGGALATRPEPRLDGPEPHERLTARFRAHLRARARLRGQSAWQVLEIEPGSPELEAERAAISFAVRYAPERWQGLDLGSDAELATAVWQHIVWARTTLSTVQGRAAHDLRFPRPAGEEVRLRRAHADEAEQAFLRGQRALAAGDAFKAVSELAAAARRFPDEPDHDAYAAWARVVAEAKRGGDKPKTAARERKSLEDATWGRRPRPRSLLALGLLCDAAGDVAFARLHFQEALAIDPRFVPARQALDMLS
jgi:hypothetical protein